LNVVLVELKLKGPQIPLPNTLEKIATAQLESLKMLTLTDVVEFTLAEKYSGVPVRLNG